jgi:hypothetical protein
MTAQFSLSSIDSASLEWPDLPGLDAKLDVLVPTPPAPPSGDPGWRQFGACLDELGATKALTQLLDARSRSLHNRADLCLRATFTIECNPAARRPVPAVGEPWGRRRGDVLPQGQDSGGGVRPHAGPQGESQAMSLQSWVANLAPLATLALLLGAWFAWLR